MWNIHTNKTEREMERDRYIDGKRERERERDEVMCSYCGH